MTDHTDAIEIRLGGRIVAGKYIVGFGQSDVPLTHAQLEILADLILARRKRPSGLSHLPSAVGSRNTRHQIVHRLRRTIDAVLGDGAGFRFIVHAGRSDYCLGVPRNSIVVDPSVEDLSPSHLAPRIVNDLLECCDADCKRRASAL